jgi:hypothetical protein
MTNECTIARCLQGATYLDVHVRVLRVAAAVVQLTHHRFEVGRQAVALLLHPARPRLLLLLQQGHRTEQPVGQQLVEDREVAAREGSAGSPAREGSLGSQAGQGQEGRRRRQRAGRGKVGSAWVVGPASRSNRLRLVRCPGC